MVPFALALALTIGTPAKLETTVTEARIATSVPVDVIWLEDQMCFCTVPTLPPMPDAYREPFGRARRVHSDFRGRVVRAVEEF